MAIMKTNYDKQECLEAGLAVILMLALVAYATENIALLLPLMGATLLAMTCPKGFLPFAIVWYGASRLMGAVMSRVLLTILFLLVVTPVGIIRSLMGSDPMKRKQFKAGAESVFVARDAAITWKDLENPF